MNHDKNTVGTVRLFFSFTTIFQAESPAKQTTKAASAASSWPSPEAPAPDGGFQHRFLAGISWI